MKEYRFRQMPIKQIIERKNKYLDRLEKLHDNIILYMDGDNKQKNNIRSEYSALKEEIRCEAHYLDKQQNSIMDVSDEHNAYEWGIIEANAFGFGVKINAPINQMMLNAVLEAEYKINKYFE